MGWTIRPKRAQTLADREDALGCTPVKNRDVREERLPGGELVIHYSVAVRPWLASLARWMGAGTAPPRAAKLQLDLMGTEVWALLDGRTPLRAVAQRFAGRHQVGTREAEIAVAQFVRQLGRRGLVALR
jgi:hypothetical protein